MNLWTRLIIKIIKGKYVNNTVNTFTCRVCELIRRSMADIENLWASNNVNNSSRNRGI